MKIETFEMERMQSTWENVVDYDLSESGVFPVTLRELVEMGFDLDWALDTPLSYSQSNGTPEPSYQWASADKPPTRLPMSPVTYAIPGSGFSGMRREYAQLTETRQSGSILWMSCAVPRTTSR